MCASKRFGTHNGFTVALTAEVEGYSIGTFAVVDQVRSGLSVDGSIDEVREYQLLFAKAPDGNTIVLIKSDIV